MQLKTFGFFDFHVTADKTRDYFIKNDFEQADVKIIAITEGQEFTDTRSHIHHLPDHEDHPAIISFFRHLFKIDKKPVNENLPFKADRSGFILSVITASEERAALSKEILERHGASYVKILDV